VWLPQRAAAVQRAEGAAAREPDASPQLLAWSASEERDDESQEAVHQQQASSPAAASQSQPETGSSSSSSSSSKGCHRGATDDEYEQAQQRVRAILAAADMGSPADAAAQLPDSVNDLVIALQLLATAPRPASLAQYRRYESAVQQLAAAVVGKFKRLLLPDAFALDTTPAAAGYSSQQEQQQLAAALAALPATKLAATAFSLGVLRLYDTQLVLALEAASAQLLQRRAFKANQLGQLVQGLAYLDHTPSPSWQAGFREATRTQLGYMRGPQVASLAVWISQHCLPGLVGNAVLGSSSVGSGSVLPGTAAVASVELDAGWVQLYLAAAGRQAGRLKPQQLGQVLHAAAGLYQQHLQQVQTDAAAATVEAGTSCGGSNLPSTILSPFDGLPLDTVAAVSKWQQQYGMRPASSGGRHQGRGQGRAGRDSSRSRGRGRGHGGHTGASDSSSDGRAREGGSSAWLPLLLAVLQQHLPELKMAHMAQALPALVQLTACPWPPSQPLLQPLLLQVQLLLPGCSGTDLVAAARAAATLAGPDSLAGQPQWCDAVLARLHAVMPTLGPQGLADAVQTLQLMRVRPYRAWVYALCQRLRVDAHMMGAGQVLSVLQGLAAVGVSLDPEVLHVVVLGLRRWMGVLSAQEMASLAAALRVMYPRVLPGRTVQQLVEELERRAAFMDVQQQQQQQMAPLRQPQLRPHML
jgi:hypothetical protein